MNKAEAFDAHLVTAPIPLSFEFQGPDGRTVPLQMEVANGSIRYIDLDTPDARPDETFPEWFERIFERTFPIPDPGFHCLEENTWATTGSEWPTIIVPGICSSGTRRSILNAVVVGANDPMPRVSKKFVTKPITSRMGEGMLIRDHATRAHHIA